MYAPNQTSTNSLLFLSSKPGSLFHKSIKQNSPAFAIKCTIQSSSLIKTNTPSNDLAIFEGTECKPKLKPIPSPNSCPLTPLDFLDRAAVVYGDNPSIIYNDITQTWSQTRIRCLKLASSIVNLGITRGDVVSVVAPNVPAMYELHWAVPMSGAILNTINLKLDARAISNLLHHSESKLVFVDYQSISLILEAIALFPSNSKRPVLINIDELCCVKSLSAKLSNSNEILDYEEMLQNGDPGFVWIRPETEWDPISLNYTSGTTSSPKGVLQSHRGAFLISLNSLFDWSVPKRPVYLWTLPMFHANGWSYTWGMAAVGGTNICIRRFDAFTIYNALEKYRVTHMCGAPVVLNMLTNHPGAKCLENPVQIMTAGAPPPATVLGRAESLGFIVSHGYGLTETGGLVVTCAWKQEWNGLSASNRAMMKARQGVGTVGFGEADVVDPISGQSVQKDGLTMGEIVLKGGSVMLGYLKDPEGTSKCMKNGWFYTGDVGVMHSDGYIEVKDRSKDVIICGGENLSSVEVETVLYSHPAVNEAAVVARPDKYWGETPCAFVSLKEGMADKVTEKDIREFCKERLPLYMVPRMVVFKEDLPKTSTGKLQKFLLRDMAKDLCSTRTQFKAD